MANSGSSCTTNTTLLGGRLLMFDLINRATHEARLCFYFVRHCGDCMIVTDSGGNKRYVIGYMDDGEVFWVRCKDLEGEENEGTDAISSDNLGERDNRSAALSS